MKPRHEAPAIGEVFDVPHPFVRDVFTEHDQDEEGWSTVERPTWCPGTRNEATLNRFGEQTSVECVADSMGAQVLTVVGVYQPLGGRTRVFYRRQWRDPDGKTFGKRRCHITTVPAFRTLVAGYRVPFQLVAEVPPPAQE